MACGVPADKRSQGGARMSYLVSIDGLSGSGKSTAIAAVSEPLHNHGFKVHVFHDRLGDETAAKLDAVQHGLELSPSARLYFMLAVRRQVIDAAIIPSMAEDDITITDRYYPSTIAYQAYGQGLGVDEVTQLALHAADGATPDRLFYIDVPGETALTRIAERGTAIQVFDAEKVVFHERVRQGYLAQARDDSTTVIIDGTKPRERVANEILQTVLEDISVRSRMTQQRSVHAGPQ